MSKTKQPHDTSPLSITTNFWDQPEAIDGSKWDKYYPFQLILVERQEDGQYRETGYKFTLPIPPQELNLDMLFATNLIANHNGITAQYGGAPFRNISMQGTTGINPIKHEGQHLEGSHNVQTIFAGTAVNAGLAGDAGAKLFSAKNYSSYKLNVNAPQLGNDPTDTNSILESGTGYYQMRMMERFLESYIALKNGAGENIRGVNSANLRLALAIWKDEAVYLVEPIQFTKRRSSAKPMEYLFTLNLRAWKRIRLSNAPQGIGNLLPKGRDPSAIASLLNRFRAANELLRAGNAVSTSLIKDPVLMVGEVLKDTSFFLHLVGTQSIPIANLPETIRNEAIGSIVQSWNANLRSQYSSLVSPQLDSALRNRATLTKEQKDELLDTLGNKITPEMLNLPAATRAKINAEKARILALGRKDFEEARNTVQRAAAIYADRIGAGSAVLSETLGLTPVEAVREPFDSDYQILYGLNETAMLLDHLAATADIDQEVPSTLEYVAGLAEQSGIAFNVPRSKFAIPFPYGGTLEALALQYLGDANRWYEIATLNGLRAPYVDEVGFKVPLLANGDRNTVTVGSRLNFFVGQTIWLSANDAPREKRHIVGIETITDDQHSIILDGAFDLSKFTTLSSAQIEAFLPGTVNSQQTIYIPSNEDATEDPITKQIPGVDIFDPLLSVSGVDLLLTPDGDLVITPDGDVRLAYGLANIIQTVRIALSTPKGALLQHPSYGLEVPTGTSTADVDVNELLKSIKAMFNQDPMFSGVRSASIVKDGSILRIVLDVGIAGTSQFVPISVNLTA